MIECKDDQNDCKEFLLGDRVIVKHKNEWLKATVVETVELNKHCLVVKTDKKVHDHVTFYNSCGLYIWIKSVSQDIIYSQIKKIDEPPRNVFKKMVLKEYFDLIVQGKKNFELRLGSLGIEEGDWLFLEEYDPDLEKKTGRWLMKESTHVLKFHPDQIPFWTREQVQKEGLKVISLGEI